MNYYWAISVDLQISIEMDNTEGRLGMFQEPLEIERPALGNKMKLRSELTGNSKRLMETLAPSEN